MTALADPALAPPATRRAARIDIARALGITLVVLGHALIGVERALGETPAGRFAIILIYAVHMPLFFFLAGLLASSALTEPGPAFRRRLLSRFAWPYLVWSLVLLAFHHGFSDLTNTSVARFNPLRILWVPPSVMWFLYVLAASLVLARALRPLPATATRLLGAALVLAGIALAGLARDTWLLPYLRFTGVFLVATTLDPARLRAAAARPAPRLAAGAALATGAAFAAAAASAPLSGYPAAELRYVPAAAGGIVLALAAGDALARSAPGAALAALGRRTMPIFVTHILILAALRIALLRAGVTDPALVLALIVPPALLLPVAAAEAADRLHVSRLLGWS